MPARNHTNDARPMFRFFTSMLVMPACMARTYFIHPCLIFGLIVATSGISSAQPAPTALFEPEVGQDGKDVVWVPTSDMLVETMLDLAQVTPQDFVIDLGSGDGRTVIAAARRGARAMGVEFNPEMVELSRRNAVEAGVSDQVEFVQADLFETDLSRATVITMFLLKEINIKLRPRILGLKSGTRIVSNTFGMGGWKPDQRARIETGCGDYCKALLWIVPARVTGNWDLPAGRLSLKQRFQTVSGTLTRGESTVPILDGRLRGNRLMFRAGETEFTGKVRDEMIEGTMRVKWQAAKRDQQD